MDEIFEEGIEIIKQGEKILSAKDKLANIAIINEKNEKNGFFTILWNRLTQLF